MLNLRWIQIGADSPSWASISDKTPNVRASRVVGRFLGSGFPKQSHLASSKSNTKHSRANFTVSVYFIYSIFIAFMQETHWKKTRFHRENSEFLRSSPEELWNLPLGNCSPQGLRVWELPNWRHEPFDVVISLPITARRCHKLHKH